MIATASLACNLTRNAAPTVSAPVEVAATSTQVPSPSPQNPFGAMISGEDIVRPEIIQIVNELGAKWVRVNVSLGNRKQDYGPFLEAGINLVLTIRNNDPSNADTTYGTVNDWPRAGFPYLDKGKYQQSVRDVLTPLLPYLANGAQVWVQAENEVGDAALNPKGVYWRGTTDQYLNQLRALYEAVKSVNPDMPVVLSSFTSEGLDAAIDPADKRHEYSSTHITRLLTEGQYDAADLHFYGCVEDISAKVKWVRDIMPADKRWISTEDGGPDSRCATTPHSWTEDLARFEEVQAQQVPARLSACAENGGSICLWFSLFDLKREDEVFSHLGLLDQSSAPPRFKPAFMAFQNFVKGYQQ